MKWMQWRVVGIACLLSAASISHAAEPVTNTLSVHRIVAAAAGEEVSEPANTAKPGDLLEYVAVFHNQGASTARGLRATLPLPLGTEFVPGSARPGAVLASIDGTTFAPLPLKRLVKDADGTSREELVPAREYRFLRWSPTDLAASGELSVSARVTVAAPAK